MTIFSKKKIISQKSSSSSGGGGNETAATIAAINHGTSAKTTLVDADEVTGQDSENSFSLIRTTWLNAWVYISSKITYTFFGTFLHAATNKTTPVDADEVGIWDSATGLYKKVALPNLIQPYVSNITSATTINLNLYYNNFFVRLSHNLSEVTYTGNLIENKEFSLAIQDDGIVRSLMFGHLCISSNYTLPTTTELTKTVLCYFKIKNGVFVLTNLVSFYSSSNYYLRPLNLNNIFPKMDGLAVVSYNGELITTGGWNPIIGAPWTPNTNRQWKSTDSGLNFTQIADAPFAKRHTHFSFVYNNKIYVVSGYGDGLSDFYKDIWTYDSVNGWVQALANWGSGIGDRLGASFCLYEDFVLVAGGQSSLNGTTGAPSTFFTDIWQINLITFSVTKLCDLPVGLNYFTYGNIVIYNDEINLIGGASYDNGTSSNHNVNHYKRSVGGVWSSVATVPSAMRNIYPNSTVWDGKIWYLCGANSGINIAGLYSYDLTSGWVRFYDNPPARHASGMCIHNDSLRIVCGNFWNDSFSVEKNIYKKEIPTINQKIVLGLFKVNPSYNGYCLKIRRSSDNTESLIGFIGDTVDTSAMLLFCGVGDGFVSALYDLSGNGNNFIQTTTTNQPKIVSAGVVITLNGKPAMEHTAGTQQLINAGVSLGTSFSSYIVASMSTDQKELMGGSGGYMFYRDGSDIYTSVQGTFIIKTATVNLNQQYVFECLRSETKVETFINHTPTSVANNTAQNLNTAFTLTSLSGESPTYNLHGKMQCIVVYNVYNTENRQGIVDRLNEYYNIF